MKFPLNIKYLLKDIRSGYNARQCNLLFTRAKIRLQDMTNKFSLFVFSLKIIQIICCAILISVPSLSVNSFCFRLMTKLQIWKNECDGYILVMRLIYKIMITLYCWMQMWYHIFMFVLYLRFLKLLGDNLVII